MPSLSLIIPTHKRADILRECLKRIDAQTVRDKIEVVVVSDGHDPETASLFQEAPNPKHQAPVFFEIPKSQQGVARNRGVERATGDIVMFIGDDILLEPVACEVHLRLHSDLGPRTSDLGTIAGVSDAKSRSPNPEVRSPGLVLGHTEWDPACAITPTMRWLDETGWQFGYRFIAPYAHQSLPKDIQHRFTYTSHISLPREIALKFPFREDVTLYGWEDIEWGWRLAQAGIPLLYEPGAKALHHHRMTLEDSLMRMETLGKSAVLVERMNPDLRLVPRGIKRWAYRFFALFPTIKGKHARAFLSSSFPSV